MKLANAGVLVVLLGCSSSSGFEVADAAGADDGTGETATDSAVDTGTGVDTGVDTGTPLDGGGEVGPPCSASDKPHPAAVFVSVGSGSDATGDGSALAPFKTIAKGIPVAKVKAAPVLVLDQGTYPEAVQLVDIDAPLTLQGGWKRTGTVWSRVCEEGARELTLIQSPAAGAVYVQGARKRTGLEHLTVISKTTPDPGQSLFGIAVRGQSLFYLDDVVVSAWKAGAGAPTPATPSAPAPVCDGVAGCVSAGAVGTTGPNGGNAPAGTFVADGYVPGTAGDGTSGGNGTHGTPGGMGAVSATDECNWGCSGSAGCNSSLKTTVAGKAGRCGCGGVGGPGGKGGKSGGASVGLYVHGASAVVDVKNSVIVAGDGGDGQAGGPGSTPSAFTKGSPGDPGICNTGGCTGSVSACYYVSSKSIAGGAAGGDGRVGGQGGNGGAGAGGPSYGLVQAAGATVTIDVPSKLTKGKGGAGGGVGLNGDSALKFTAP